MPSEIKRDAGEKYRLVFRLIDQLCATYTGYQILIAQSGTKGLELVQGKTPDLIVLDTDLPDFDGFALCQILRTYQQNSSIAIIIVTVRSKEVELTPMEFELLKNISYKPRSGIY